MDEELDAIEIEFGERIIHVRDAPWGSKNRSMIVESANRVAVLQRYWSRESARTRIDATRQFSTGLNAKGVASPRVILSDLEATTPWALFEFMKGEVAYVSAGDDLSSPSFVGIAREMGQVIGVLRGLDPTTFDLPTLWVHPLQLCSAAAGWLDELLPHLTRDAIAEARHLIDDVPSLFSSRRRVVAHGDFGPQNVLVKHGRVVAVLDFEDARLADPLLDLAWWAWLVRAHTPRAFERTWGEIVTASGTEPEEERFDRRIFTLIILRLLETASAFREMQPEKHASWARRLTDTLEWRSTAFHRIW